MFRIVNCENLGVAKEKDLEVEHQNSHTPDSVIEDPKRDTRPEEWFKLPIPYLDVAKMELITLTLPSRARKQPYKWGNSLEQGY